MTDIHRLPTPTLKGVLLRDLLVQNRLVELREKAPDVELSCVLNQNVKVGVADESGKSVPVVVITLELIARRADDPKSEPSLAANAVFHAAFEHEEGVSRQDWIAYTSSPLARNIALQAVAVCQRQFKQQVGLTGIPQDKLLFSKMGNFDAGQREIRPAVPRKSKRRVKNQ